jgi:hypothetical protein
LQLENESSSLKVYLQKSSLKEKEYQEQISKVDLKETNLQVKVKCQVDEQKQGSKVDLQTIDLNVQVELIKETTTLEL